MKNHKKDAEEIKDLLIKLIANTNLSQYSTYIAEDVVDECFSKCHEFLQGETQYNDLIEIISDYLDLGGAYVPLINSIL